MHMIEADYESGVLRPTEPLRLRPGERVRIILVRPTQPARWNLVRLAQRSAEDEALAKAGLAPWASSLDGEDKR